MGNEISQSVPPDIVRAADLDEKLDDYRLVADSHHKQDVYTKDASYTKDEANARYRLASDSYTKAETDTKLDAVDDVCGGGPAS